jgi:type II secretory pathway pseudopilin PulG
MPATCANRHRAATIQSSEAGLTLIEVLVAIGLFMVVAAGVAQLSAVATAAMRNAREQTTAVVLAAAKMDQLRSLAWDYGPESPVAALTPRSDETTDLSDPSYPDSGRGLQASPPDALTTNAAGCVDYLDASGRWLGNGARAPASAVFVRRWSIVPLSADPERTLILRVLVTTVREEQLRGARMWQRRTGTQSLLVSIRTRRA